MGGGDETRPVSISIGVCEEERDGWRAILGRLDAAIYRRSSMVQRLAKGRWQCGREFVRATLLGAPLASRHRRSPGRAEGAGGGGDGWRWVEGDGEDVRAVAVVDCCWSIPMRARHAPGQQEDDRRRKLGRVGGCAVSPFSCRKRLSLSLRVVVFTPAHARLRLKTPRRRRPRWWWW